MCARARARACMHVGVRVLACMHVCVHARDVHPKARHRQYRIDQILEQALHCGTCPCLCPWLTSYQHITFLLVYLQLLASLSSLGTESVRHIAVFVSQFVCVGWSVCCHHPHTSPPVDLPVLNLISVCCHHPHRSPPVDLPVFTLISVCCHHPHRSQPVDLPVFTLISVCCHHPHRSPPVDLPVFTLISVCCHHPHRSPPVDLPVFTLISVCCHHPHRSPPVDLPVFTLFSVCATAPETERRALYICQRTVFHCNQFLTCVL